MLGINYCKLFKDGHKRNAGFNSKLKVKEAVQMYWEIMQSVPFTQFR